MQVTTAVIPAAGFGTRMLPQTKAMPKEMLPLVDKPVIQFIVEELVEAGIKNIIIVTGWHKRAIEDHFDYPYELEQRLKSSGKLKELNKIKAISELANFTYVRQKPGNGNAVAIMSVKHLLKDQPFFVLWGDIIADFNRAKLALKAFKKYQSTILCASKTTDPASADKYGFIKGSKIEKDIWKVERIIEKPGKDNLPSDWAVYSGYLLTPDIFEELEKIKPGKGGEYYLTDAIDALAQKKNVYAVEMSEGEPKDTGNKLSYYKAFVEQGLKDPEIQKETREYIKNLNL